MKREEAAGVWFESAQEYEHHFREVLTSHRDQITTTLLMREKKEEEMQQHQLHGLVIDLRFWGLQVGVELDKRIEDDPTAAVNELFRMVEVLDIVGWCRFLFSLSRLDLEVPRLFLESDEQGLRGSY